MQARSRTASTTKADFVDLVMRADSPCNSVIADTEKLSSCARWTAPSTSLRAGLGALPTCFDANVALGLIFPCYSRNFPSVTFSLHHAELTLCWIQEFKPYRENYESSRGQKTSNQNCSSRKRSIALCWIPRVVRL